MSLNVTITKDTFIPSKPWKVELVTSKGKSWLNSFSTKKSAIEAIKGCSPLAIVTDTKTGKVL
jgi:hypothetical protein